MENLKNYVVAVVGGIIIGAVGFYYFVDRSKQQLKPIADTRDHSTKKTYGKIIKYLPSKCDGISQDISSVEEYGTEVQKDVKTDAPILSDNFLLDTDFKSEIGFRYKPFDHIPLLNKIFIGPEYNVESDELKLKATFSTRLNL